MAYFEIGCVCVFRAALAFTSSSSTHHQQPSLATRFASMPSQFLDSFGPRPAIPLPRLPSSSSAAAVAMAGTVATNASVAVKAIWKRNTKRAWNTTKEEEDVAVDASSNGGSPETALKSVVEAPGVEAVMAAQAAGGRHDHTPPDDATSLQRRPRRRRQHRFQTVRLGGRDGAQSPRLVLIDIHPTPSTALRVWDCTTTSFDAANQQQQQRQHRDDDEMDLGDSSVLGAAALSPELMLHVSMDAIEAWTGGIGGIGGGGIEHARLIDARFGGGGGGDDSIVYLLLDDGVVALNIASGRVVARRTLRRGRRIEVSRWAVVVAVVDDDNDKDDEDSATTTALHILDRRTLEPMCSSLTLKSPVWALRGRLLAVITEQQAPAAPGSQTPHDSSSASEGSTNASFRLRARGCGSIVTNSSVSAAVVTANAGQHPSAKAQSSSSSSSYSRDLWDMVVTRSSQGGGGTGGEGASSRSAPPRWIKIFDLAKLGVKLGSRNLVAHFAIPSTEAREPPSLLEFSPDGTRLAVATTGGRTVVVVDIRPSPSQPSLGEVWSRYLLRRGMTPAYVQSITWDCTGRLLAVSTDRTAHIFHMHPDGGVPSDEPFDGDRTANQEAQTLSTVVGPIVRLRAKGEIAIGGRGGGMGVALSCDGEDGIVIKHALKPSAEAVAVRRWELEAREGTGVRVRAANRRRRDTSHGQVVTTTMASRLLPPIIYQDRSVSFADLVTDEPRAYRRGTNCETSTPPLLDDPKSAIESLLDPRPATAIMPALPNGSHGKWAALKLRRRDPGASESPTKYGDHFVSDEETGFVNDQSLPDDEEEGKSLGESWDEELAGRMD